MTKLASTMRFVWVNDRAPGPPSTCAHCRTSVTTGYLRELSSQLPYCDHACYLGRRNETAPMVWRTGAGIDGLPILGLPGLWATVKVRFSASWDTHPTKQPRSPGSLKARLDVDQLDRGIERGLCRCSALLSAASMRPLYGCLSILSDVSLAAFMISALG